MGYNICKSTMGTHSHFAAVKFLVDLCLKPPWGLNFDVDHSIGEGEVSVFPSVLFYFIKGVQLGGRRGELLGEGGVASESTFPKEQILSLTMFCLR